MSAFERKLEESKVFESFPNVIIERDLVILWTCRKENFLLISPIFDTLTMENLPLKLTLNKG